VTARVLLVDDDRSFCELVAARLRSRGFEVSWRVSALEALELLGAEAFEVVVTDVNLPGMNGIALCERIATNHPALPVLVITAFGELETAIAAIRVGAHDFLNKPFEIEELQLRLERACRDRALRAEVERLRQLAGGGEAPALPLGESAAMRKVRDLMARFAESEAPVLVSGETGTGKELVARAIHARSRRREAPFVVVDCGAIPHALLESELFGHVRGAFTDARSDRRGLFVEAHGGTLFLDEIGELPLDLQPKLLRALQERVVRPVGSNAEQAFDVRLIAATNRDLAALVDEGRFRRDLFFRLDVLHLALPPLRSRGQDVLQLAQHFLSRFAVRSGRPVKGLSGPVAERLVSYAWPGNVRELMNCIERAVALADYADLVVEDLPERIRSYRSDDVIVASRDPAELVPLEEVERRYILRVVEAVGGRKTEAARILGLDRKTLYRKLERYAAGGREREPELP
jgi:two-component system response regulator HydG